MTTVTDHKIKTESANNATSDNATKLHVVIIDEDPAVPISMALQLEHCFEIECFTTAQEALSHICENASVIEFIILDSALPDVLQLLSLLKCDVRLEQIPVILNIKAIEPMTIKYALELAGFFTFRS